MAVNLVMCWFVLMKKSLCKIIFPLILWPAFVFAAGDLSELKHFFIEKKVDEAIKILKEQHRSLLKNANDYQELSRWLSIFLYDETMVIHEKALGLASTKPDEADAEFKKALVAEPYNKEIISNYMVFLITTQRYKQVISEMTAKLVEQPYMELYKVYQAHAQLLQGQKQDPVMCDGRDLDEIELQYCQYVQLVYRLSALNANTDPKEALREINALKPLFKKVKIPDAFYWLWKARGDLAELKKYVSLCQSLSAKDKKTYRIVPGVCSQLEEATQKLKTGAQWISSQKIKALPSQP